MLALVSLGVPLALTLRDRVDAEVRSQSRSQADVVAATAAELLAPSARPELRRLAATAAHSVRGRVLVVDARGNLLADSAPGRDAGAPYRSRPEIAAALAGRATQITRHSDTLGTDLLATAVPVLRHGRPVGAVRVTQGIAAVHRAVWRAIAELAVIAAVVLALGLVAALTLAGQIARPLRRLSAAARRVGGGDLSARVPVEGSREQREVAGTFNDMTARVERLVRSQGDFVADASHQLRTPLTGLRLRVEEARVRARDPREREDLDAALAEADRLSTTVSELLLLSRAGERDAPAERLDLAELARAAGGRWSATAARSRHVLDVEDGAGGAWAARADVERVLDVLVENALRYSPGGTHVLVRSGPRRLELLDEGPGLAQGEQEAVFERFHRGAAGRESPGGTGLGLPIARELLRPWNAEVTLENREGGGARAIVTFAPENGAAA